MNFTKEFSRGLLILFGASILLVMYVIFLKFQQNYGISVDKPNSLVRIFGNQFHYGFSIIIFWAVVWYITKDRTASLVACLIQLFHFLIIPISSTLIHSPHEVFILMNKLDLIIHLCAFITFGLLHFKTYRGMWMGLVYFIMVGVGAGLNGESYYHWMEVILRAVGIRDPFTLRLELENGHNVSFNYLSLLVNEMVNILKLCVFWYIYLLIRIPKNFDVKLSVTPIINAISPVTYSIIYWTARLILFISVVRFIESLQNSSRSGFGLPSWYITLCFCFGIYVTTSMYRNFLSAYLATKGKFPRWTYWLLNVPILNIIAWIASLCFKTKPIQKAYSVDDREEKGIPQAKDEVIFLQVQEDFLANLKNQTFKIFIGFVIAIMLFWGASRMNLSIGLGDAAGYIWIKLVTLGLMIIYMTEKRLLIPLYLLQALSITFVVITYDPKDLEPYLVLGLVNLVLFYGLFHFDDLKFVDLNLQLNVQQENEGSQDFKMLGNI